MHPTISAVLRSAGIFDTHKIKHLYCTSADPSPERFTGNLVVGRSRLRCITALCSGHCNGLCGYWVRHSGSHSSNFVFCSSIQPGSCFVVHLHGQPLKWNANANHNHASLHGPGLGLEFRLAGIGGPPKGSAIPNHPASLFAGSSQTFLENVVRIVQNRLLRILAGLVVAFLKNCNKSSDSFNWMAGLAKVEAGCSNLLGLQKPTEMPYNNPNVRFSGPQPCPDNKCPGL